MANQHRIVSERTGCSSEKLMLMRVECACDINATKAITYAMSHNVTELSAVALRVGSVVSESKFTKASDNGTTSRLRHGV